MRTEKIKDKAPWLEVILEEGETISGYKAMNKDWTCRDFKFEQGQTYTHKGDIVPCESGFHFCANVVDCFGYYDFEKCIIVNVVASGKIIQDGIKFCAEVIRIGEEFMPEELDELFIDANRNSGNGNSGDRNSGNGNSGDGNSGYGNSGDRNSGDRNSGNGNSGYGNSGYGNSGDRNSGDRNSGNGNSGDRNSGDGNSGYGNSGYGNSGYGNSGYGNSGDRNSGYGNSGDFHSGVFCTTPREKTKIKFFDKTSKWTWDKWMDSDAHKECEEIIRNGIQISDISDLQWDILATMPNWDKDKFIACIEALRGKV